VGGDASGGGKLHKKVLEDVVTRTARKCVSDPVSARPDKGGEFSTGKNYGYRGMVMQLLGESCRCADFLQGGYLGKGLFATWTDCTVGIKRKRGRRIFFGSQDTTARGVR